MSQQATLYEEETGSLCPHCMKRGNFTVRTSYSFAVTGEVCWVETLTCDLCSQEATRDQLETGEPHPEMCEYCGCTPDPPYFEEHVAECSQRGLIRPADPWDDDSREDF